MGNWEWGIGNGGSGMGIGNWTLGIGHWLLVTCYLLFVIRYLSLGLLASLFSNTERFNIAVHNQTGIAGNLVNCPIPPPNF
jgi:hypothetical protein